MEPAPNESVTCLPHGKSQSGVNESPSVRDLAARYRQERDNFAQAQHDGDTGGGHDGITEKKTQRATRGERPCSSQEETSTNDTSDATVCDHIQSA